MKKECSRTALCEGTGHYLTSVIHYCLMGFVKRNAQKASASKNAVLVILVSRENRLLQGSEHCYT